MAERLGDKVQRRSNFLPSSKTHMKKTYHGIARIYPEVLATTLVAFGRWHIGPARGTPSPSPETERGGLTDSAQ